MGMASKSSSLAKPGGTVETNKRLGDLLQEQQEPFVLDVYLLEKGYPSTPRKGRRGHHYPTATASGCCPCDISNRNMKRFRTCGFGLNLNTPMRVVRNLGIPHQIHPSVLTPQRNINKLLSVSTSSRRAAKSHHLTAYDDGGRIGVATPDPPDLKLENTTHCPQATDLGRFSSASSSVDRDKLELLVSGIVSVSPSSSQQDHFLSSSVHDPQASILCNVNHQEAATDGEFPWGCIENGNKQLSPVSVVQEVSLPPASLVNLRKPPRAVGFCPRIRTCTHSEVEEEEGAASISIPNQPKDSRVAQDSILSATSLWELLLQHSLAQKQDSGGVEAVLKELLGSGVLGSSSHSQYVKTKKVLEQTRQLLCDCVREAKEKHRRNAGSGGGRTRRSDGEELGKIICDEIRTWGKQSVDIANLNELVEADFWDTTVEEGWSGFLKPYSIKDGIGVEIADAILEEMSNEIVAAMIHNQYLRIEYPYGN